MRVYVLAGGKSHRFGADKALHRPAGWAVPLALHVARRLRVLDDAPTLVVANASPAHAALGLRVIEDVERDRGPLGGLASALDDAAARGATHVAVVACDMPWVDPECMRELAHRIDEAPAQLACAPRRGARWDPLHAVYSIGARQAVDEHLRAGQLSLQALMERLDARAVDLDGVADVERWAASLRNVNRPADLTSWPDDDGDRRGGAD